MHLDHSPYATVRAHPRFGPEKQCVRRKWRIVMPERVARARSVLAGRRGIGAHIGFGVVIVIQPAEPRRMAGRRCTALDVAFSIPAACFVVGTLPYLRLVLAQRVGRQCLVVFPMHCPAGERLIFWATCRRGVHPPACTHKAAREHADLRLSASSSTWPATTSLER